MRSLPLVVGAWAAALVTNLLPGAALAGDAAGANATSTAAGSTIPATAGAPPDHPTPWAFLQTDRALPLVIGGLCALTLAAMGAGAVLHRCCRRCARRRQNVSSVSA
ncbi:envelope glycoprotein J [Cercopithecine alphaherpesvirus 2]|uniref:GJ glycoprotein n=1 Tax=Cercopithecine alphaherpesvirus 2 TaxID=10317 RepID=Q69368_9ALPH|nr:envelope glycoprotein J [Cercopithecine alphaherpesvirus 2]AAA46177.1 gJ glycoprotein [Cercopithecine alphaherpesvirus 2]AAU88130.1 virion glycoprotein J [Cercopithecine alphaherpesvirus 2]